MKYLIDTQIFLWWLNEDKRLNKSTLETISDPKNFIQVSVVSAWEISIKLKANPKFNLKTSIKRAFEISGFDVLDISLKHVLAIHKLPMYHKDPFDRMLIAQTKVEKCTFITADSKIKRYKIPLLEN